MSATTAIVRSQSPTSCEGAPPTGKALAPLYTRLAALSWGRVCLGGWPLPDGRPASALEVGLAADDRARFVTTFRHHTTPRSSVLAGSSLRWALSPPCHLLPPQSRHCARRCFLRSDVAAPQRLVCSFALQGPNIPPQTSLPAQPPCVPCTLGKRDIACAHPDSLILCAPPLLLPADVDIASTHGTTTHPTHTRAHTHYHALPRTTTRSASHV